MPNPRVLLTGIARGESPRWHDGRLWFADWMAQVDGHPDGICLDAEGAVWHGDVPNQRCVRVRDGGEVLQKIELDRGCFACMLGGTDCQTLFMLAAHWGDPAAFTGEARTGQVLAVPAPVPAAGWP